MRPLLVSHSDLQGGAARACWRLYRGLSEADADPRMLVLARRSDDPAVAAFAPPGGTLRRARRRFDQERLLRSPLRREGGGTREQFSDGRSEHRTDLLSQLGAPSVINLHWVAGMFEESRALPAAAGRAPLVWTLHDMNPFTGGCHYDGGCGRFAQTPGCGACPQLAGEVVRDGSRRIWQRRRRTWAKVPRDRLTIVTPSRWLAGEVRRSSLWGGRPVEVIPYGIDTSLFRPRDRAAGREVLGLPPDAKVVLFVSQSLSSGRKGGDLLAEALGRLVDLPNLFFLTVGGGSPDVPPEVPVRTVGSVNDERLLSFAYSAADIFVIPSRQDNLPNTVLEALSCGTPVVGFEAGGIPDMVRPGKTGLLANAGDAADLAASIRRLLADDDLRRRCGRTARRIAEAEYPLRLQARRYLALFERVAQAVGPPGP